MSKLKDKPAWKALQAHFEHTRDLHMRELFAQDPRRFETFSLRVDDLLLDYSRNRITADTMQLLHTLARECEVPAWTQRMFNGSKINFTERRAVLHTALRNRGNTPVEVDGEDVMPAVNRVLEKMRVFTETVRSGGWKGYSGKSITDVVNIGIGGSDLGPVMVTEALRPYGGSLNVHLVSNVDGSQASDTPADLEPDPPLFPVPSKTFTTPQTPANAHQPPRWLPHAPPADTAAPTHF